MPSSAYRVLDLETVVDLNVWTPPEPKYVLAPGEKVLAIGGRPGELKLQTPAVVVPDAPAFPPPHAQRVVAAAWVNLSDQDGRFYHFDSLHLDCRWSHDPKEIDICEKNLLADFIVAQDDGAMIVTWNGRTFDLPIINLRSFHHKTPCRWYYRDKDIRYRYSEAGHLDLMDVFSDYGASKNMKLHDACRLAGLPGKTGEVGGGNIAEIHARGDAPEAMASVAHYCARDALQTALLFVRHRYHRGMINVEEHDAALRSFAEGPAATYLSDVDWSRLKVGR